MDKETRLSDTQILEDEYQGQTENTKPQTEDIKSPPEVIIPQTRRFYLFITSYFKTPKGPNDSENQIYVTTHSKDDLSIHLPTSHTAEPLSDPPSPDSAVFSDEEDPVANISTLGNTHGSTLGNTHGSTLDNQHGAMPGFNRASTSTWSWFSRASTRTVSESFSEQFNTRDDVSALKEMTTAHYIDKKLRSSCKQCGGKFGMRRRPRHCRRCGEVFCASCVQFKRRLNMLAHPDPDGVHKKVCEKCYNEDIQQLGQVRSWTLDYERERELCKCERILNQRVHSKTQTFWRDQLDVEAECRRLLHGFERNVGPSESKKAVQELQALINVPYWQRSSFWSVENVTSTCRQCNRSLGLRKSKRNCKVCSLALCKKCSYKELLIYYDDGIQREHKSAKLALINVTGCPAKEPNISLLLYVCSDCKAFIQEKQVDNQCWYERLRDDSPLADIYRMDTVFVQLKDKITTGIQTLEIDDQDAPLNIENQKLTQVGTYLDEYLTLFKSLQKVLERAESKSQHVFIKNYTKGKYDFYMEARRQYRKMCKKDNHTDT